MNSRSTIIVAVLSVVLTFLTFARKDIERKVKEWEVPAKKVEQSEEDKLIAAVRKATDKNRITLPQGRIVFQPVFHWEDGKVTAQGTGFIIKTPSGQHAGVTSAHFINFKGPPLLVAQWTDVVSEESVALFKKSWGKPGSAGTVGDRRPDYLILPAEFPIENVTALELDERTKVPVGERIYFPDKSEQENGHVWLEGSVIEVSEKMILIKMDHDLQLQSQSGSPFISQKTGKVIGTLSDARKVPKQILLLCPSAGIAEALKTTEHPQLKDAVGVTGAQRKK